MKIIKKVQCLKCGVVISGSEVIPMRCSCGEVSIINDKIISENQNYIDMSPKLLNE